jgi:hypothetical protein
LKVGGEGVGFGGVDETAGTPADGLTVRLDGVGWRNSLAGCVSNSETGSPLKTSWSGSSGELVEVDGRVGFDLRAGIGERSDGWVGTVERCYSLEVDHGCIRTSHQLDVHFLPNASCVGCPSNGTFCSFVSGWGRSRNRVGLSQERKNDKSESTKFVHCYYFLLR